MEKTVLFGKSPPMLGGMIQGTSLMNNEEVR